MAQCYTALQETEMRPRKWRLKFPSCHAADPW
jgi:hypothetical protein